MSGDIMSGFKQYIAARPTSGALDMNVLVLTSGFWPSYRTFDCLLPAELLSAQQVGARQSTSAHLFPAVHLQWHLYGVQPHCHPAGHIHFYATAGVCGLLPVQARRPQAGVAQRLQQLPSAGAVCVGGEGAPGLPAPGALAARGRHATVAMRCCVSPAVPGAAAGRRQGLRCAWCETQPCRVPPRMQAIILLLFNEHEQLSFGDILAAVRLEEGELRRTLASLSVAKERCGGPVGVLVQGMPWGPR